MRYQRSPNEPINDARYFDFNFIYATVTNDDGVVTGIFRDGFYVAVLSPKLQ